MFSSLTTIVFLAAASLLLLIGLMATAFVRIATVLAILRVAIGAPSVPPASVIAGLSLILTLFVMAPVGEAVLDRARPLFESLQQQEQSGLQDFDSIREKALNAIAPLVDFMKKTADEKEVEYFHQAAVDLGNRDAKEDSFLVLLSAFVTGELKHAFRAGFLLFVPFVIIDLVVVNIIFAIGLTTLQPATVALPLKLLLFLLADGWHLVAGGLIKGFVP